MNSNRVRHLISSIAVLGIISACGGGQRPEPTAAVGSSPLPVSRDREPSAAPQTLAVPKLATSGPQRTTGDSVSRQIIDSYDPATTRLTIPLVQVGVRYYRDVVITVGPIVSIGVAKSTSGVFDRYDIATNQLTAPVVKVGSKLYYNVVAVVGTIISYGGVVDSYSVPVDLSQVHYPESYRTVTTSEADINTDPCNLTLNAVNYPASWQGRYPLPAVSGAPLKPGVKRAVNLKDIGLQPGNPASIFRNAPGAPSGCAGDLHAALARTMQRLHALGSDYVTVTQWHWASNRPDGSWYFTRADDTFGSITEADLAYLVQTAHAAGLKVIMQNQIQGYFDSATPNSYFVPPATMDNFTKWFAAYQAYIGERSVYFQSLGIDVWELGCGHCMYHDEGDGSDAAKALFASEYAKALDNLKLAYTGQVLMANNSWLYLTPSLASRIDIFQVSAGVYTFPADLTDNLTVARYKSLIMAAGFQAGINAYDGFGKTIMVDYGIQSRADIFTRPGYMEETACTPGFGSFDTSGTACIERETTTDFSMQAIVHEATLEAINAATAPHSTLMVLVNDYWETDSLMPFSAFPNIAFSIRNKPAEGIVKAWFAR